MPPKAEKIIVAPQLDVASLASVFDAIAKYAAARLAFIDEQKSTGHWLAGNDNKVGAIAEFWIKRHYLIEGFTIDEIPVSNNAGWDFKASKDERSWRVSVKAITGENKRGKQVQLIKGRINDPIDWNKVKWDEFALIILSSTLQPEKIAIAKRAEVQECHENPNDCFNAHRAVDRLWPTTWMREIGVRFPDVQKLMSVDK